MLRVRAVDRRDTEEVSNQRAPKTKYQSRELQLRHAHADVLRFEMALSVVDAVCTNGKRVGVWYGIGVWYGVLGFKGVGESGEVG